MRKNDGNDSLDDSGVVDVEFVRGRDTTIDDELKALKEKVETYIILCTNTSIH